MARFPPQRAEGATLESLKDTEGLFNTPTNVQIMNNLVLKDTFGINDEKTSQCNPLLWIKDSVGAGSLLGEVSK